jgi:hypothetical protein
MPTTFKRSIVQLLATATPSLLEAALGFD